MPDQDAQFNHAQPQRRRAAIAAEPPVRDVCVVGGGTAGWMTALLLADSAFGARLRVTVLESPSVGIIGVGEGSTPWLKDFFDRLGIAESTWMPACNATYKSGITFDGWSTRPGFERYFHPFSSSLDERVMRAFGEHAHARLAGVDLHAHPDRFFVSAAIARQCRAPLAGPDAPCSVRYGYHFDSTLLGAFLREEALRRGVTHVARHMTRAVQDADGDIRAVELADGGTLAAGFWVDCSGFASLLATQALKTPFVPFGENLFNDAAIAVPTPNAGPLMSQTVSTALRHGWAWKIPLTSRDGNGYVYSSAHCSADEAERELRAHLGLLDADVPARHLKMRVGRLEKTWHRNCAAVGLAQGFIEPLEATALLFVQRTAERLVAALEAGDLGAAAQRRFNDAINANFEGARDYIVSHYKTNSRGDTAYWRDNAANTALSEPLEDLLRTWLARRPLIDGLRSGAFGYGYPPASWYALLAGMGVFPPAAQLRAPAPHERAHDLAAIDALVAQSAAAFPDHRDFLAAHAARAAQAVELAVAP